MNIVIGLGKTGLSCIDYFYRLDVPVMAMDSRELPPGLSGMKQKYPTVRFVTGCFDADILCQAEQLVVSPGVALTTPEIQQAIDAGVAVTGDVDIFARAAKAPIIAITGSNGKTTLTTLVTQMINDTGLSAIACGNIGTPALELLAEPIPDYYVMEISSFQLETTTNLNAKIATVLNITPDHLDRYVGFTDYAKAKLRVFQGAEMALVNIDDAYSENLAVNPKTTFSLSDSAANYYLAEANDSLSIMHHAEVCLAVSELAQQGQHHYQNSLAALAIGDYVGLSRQSMQHTLAEFEGLAHRCQKVASSDGIDWYNDSKATNLGATVAALTTLHPLYSQIILIAGGDAKGADLSPLGTVAEKFTSHVILIGESAPMLAEVLANKVSTSHALSLQDAIFQAQVLASAPTAVVLSPACASFDMFSNYEERGNLFVQAVRELIDATGAISST